MEITFQTVLTPNQTTIKLENEQGQLLIGSEKPTLLENSFYLFYHEKRCVALGKKVHPETFDTVIMLQLPWELEVEYLLYLLTEQAENSGLSIEKDDSSPESIPENAKKKLLDYQKKILAILELFGYTLENPSTPAPKKKRPAKSRHRWSKEVSEIPFTVNFRDSSATLYWISRNEMLIKAGAVLLKEPPLNKDGSLGYDAKYGEKLREDYKNSISDGKTTEDIVVKSVNEASLLLYFGGTNSWLELMDENGKTIDEWTKVE